jgi:guanylate kinase
MLILSGPSGIGKTYLLQHLEPRGFSPVLQTTTRTHRDGEVNGVDYEFLELAEYERIVRETGDFFMDNQFFGNRYGIRRSAIERIWSIGRIPVLIIYIGVVDQIAQEFPDSRRVFLVPVRENLLESRLNKRSKNQEEIRYRLTKAREELEMLEDSRYRNFYQLVLELANDDIRGLTQQLEEFVYQESS